MFKPPAPWPRPSNVPRRQLYETWTIEFFRLVVLEDHEQLAWFLEATRGHGLMLSRRPTEARTESDGRITAAVGEMKDQSAEWLMRCLKKKKLDQEKHGWASLGVWLPA